MPTDTRTRARELLKAATPGPWYVASDDEWIVASNTGNICELAGGKVYKPNGRLIASAPELLTALLAELDALEELIHTESGFDDHHPNYSPAWAVREMARAWAAESAALEAAEARVARLEEALKPFAGDERILEVGYDGPDRECARAALQVDPELAPSPLKEPTDGDGSDGSG